MEEQNTSFRFLGSIHEPGRTLGLADYLSRHPSDYESSTVKAEEMFNSWFTVNVVDEIVPSMNRKVTIENEPIRIEREIKESKAWTRVC